jgi:exodeoxyribonuclease V alpha subunit
MRRSWCGPSAKPCSRVIQQEPERLHQVTGIGPKRAERIIAGWAEQRVIREIMLFLHSNGVGTSRAVRIYKTYGADAVRLISENPYRLARDIRGIGFRTADQIAGKLGIEKTALIRVRAGISYALAEAMDEGHCGLPVEELVPLTEKLLEVPVELVETALNLELQGGSVVADDLEGRRCVFLAALYRAELEIAEKLRTLAARKPLWASRCLKKGVRVVSPTGKQWTEANIGNALAGREIAQHLRELGTIARGPAPLTKRDRSRFLSTLDTAVQAALREATRS